MDSIDVDAAINGDDNGHSGLAAIESRVQEYQQNPRLLDVHLTALLNPVFNALTLRILHNGRDSSSSSSNNYNNIDCLCHYVYVFCKVRGYKTIVQLMPSDVHLLAPVVAVAQQQIDNWINAYVLMLWASLLVRAPFDLSTIGENIRMDIRRLVDMHLGAASKQRESAAILLARLFMRQGGEINAEINESMVKERMTGSINGSINESINGSINESMTESINGSMTESINKGSIDKGSIYKGSIDKGSVISESKIYENKISIYENKISISEIRAFILQIESADQFTQIGALECLAQLLKHGPRNILIQIQSVIFECVTRIQKQHQHDDSIGLLVSKITQRTSILLLHPAPCLDPPPELDDKVGFLLQSLSGKKLRSRYSAAKGIARIVARLEEDLACQIVEEVLNLFEECEITSFNEPAWNGACLALAELARKRLIQNDGKDNLLHRALMCIIRATSYDCVQGTQVVGVSVRDAAFYALWAILRSYVLPEDEILLMQLAPSILNIALFDREVTIRRAASATFQEGVGRQTEKVFLHGIQIIQEADYYDVGIRNRCFQEIAPRIACLDVYANSIVQHLIMNVRVHWDPQIRVSAADCIAIIARNNETPENVKSHIEGWLPKIAVNTQEVDDFTLAHGSLSMLATLQGVFKNPDPPFLSVLDLIAQKFARGHRGQIMNDAVCRYITICCNSFGGEIPKETLVSWKTIVDEKLPIASEEQREHTLDALAALSRTSAATDDLISKYIQHIKSRKSILRPSSCFAIGACDFRTVSRDQAEEAVQSLISVVKDVSIGAEIRRDSMKSLRSVLAKMNARSDGMSLVDSRSIHGYVDLFKLLLDDYTIAQKGDVGSWIRIEAMQSLELVFGITKSDEIASVVLKILKQVVEGLNKVREQAVVTIRTLLRFKEMDEDETVLRDWIHTVKLDWATPESIYETLGPVLLCKKYQYSLLSGFVFASHHQGLVSDLLSEAFADGTQKRAISSSLKPLLLCHTDLQPIFLKHFCTLLVTERSQDSNCISLLSSMIENNYFADVRQSSVFDDLVDLLIKRVMRSKSVPLITASAEVLANLITYTNTSKYVKSTACEGMVSLLQNHIPRVRYAVSEILYMLHQQISMDLPSETIDWEYNLDEILTTSDWYETPANLQPNIDAIRSQLRIYVDSVSSSSDL